METGPACTQQVGHASSSPAAPPHLPYTTAHAPHFGAQAAAGVGLPQALQVCVLVEHVQHPRVAVLCQAFKEIGVQLGPQREPRAGGGHQLRLPRRAVAPGEAGAEEAHRAQREGQAQHVDRRGISRRRPLAAVRPMLLLLLLGLLGSPLAAIRLCCWCRCVAADRCHGRALQLGQSQLKLPQLALQGKTAAGWRVSVGLAAAGGHTAWT